jgi:hypothetical protein
VDVVAQRPDAEVVIVEVADRVTRVEFQRAEAGGLPVLVAVDEFIGVTADFVVKIVKRKAEPSAAVQLDEGVTVEYPFEVKTYGFDVVNVGPRLERKGTRG